MGVAIKQALLEALELRLFPVMARWFAEAGVSVQEAIDSLKSAAIAEARRSTPEGVDPDSISLISIRTGLSRRLVRESLTRERATERPPGEGGHRGERVMAGWWHDPDFLDEGGQPRILKLTKGRHSFEELCRRYSGERQSRTILKDLEQVGAVTVIEPGGSVRVLRRSYAAVGWTEAGQTAMAEQLAEHIETCLNNLKYPQGTQHWLCRRVANALVRSDHAKILLRDLRSQVDAQADTCYDALSDPQYTADPLDPGAELISVTFYINRKPGVPAPPTAALRGAAQRNHSALSVEPAEDGPTTHAPTLRSNRRRRRSKKKE